MGPIQKATVVIVTTLILAYLGAALKVSIDTGNWWWAFPAVWACTIAGIWYLGEDVDRETMRKIWRKITLR